MKKTILLAGVACLFSFNADADNMQINPYIGLNYVYSSIDIDDTGEVSLFEDTFNSGAIYAGVKFNQYVSLEAFYQQSGKEEKNFANGKSEVSFYAWGADAVGYMPLGNSKAELLGSFGLGYYDVDLKARIYNPALSASGNDDAVGYRFGAGLQYNITNNWAIRGMGRYIFLDGIDDVDSMYEFSVGVKYSF